MCQSLELEPDFYFWGFRVDLLLNGLLKGLSAKLAK